MCDTDFGWALKVLKAGKRVTRKGWHKEAMFLKLENSCGGMEPFISITVEDGYTIPWLASQADMLANDWEEV